LMRAIENTNAVTVHYSTGGRAQGNYVPVSGTIKWAPGEEGEKKIVVPVKENDVYDERREFNLNLTEPAGARLGKNTHAYGIVDDAISTLTIANGIQSEFGTGLYVGVLRGQSSVTIEIERGGGLDGTLRMRDFGFEDSTAIAGEDYESVTNLSLFWNRGEGGRRRFTAPLKSDAVATDMRGFYVTAYVDLEGAAAPQSFGIVVMILPPNAKPPLRITGWNWHAGADTITLNANAPGGGLVELLESNDADGPWTPIEGLPATDGTVSFQRNVANFGQQKYFYVRVKP
jgi:hypothetical protein